MKYNPQIGSEVSHSINPDWIGTIVEKGTGRFEGCFRVAWSNGQYLFHPIEFLIKPGSPASPGPDVTGDDSVFEDQGDSGVRELEIADLAPEPHEVEPDAEDTELVPSEHPEEGATVQD